MPLGSIVRSDIPEAVSRVTNSLEQGGFEAFLVGGCVRDLLLKRTPKDWDITTDALPDEIAALFPETFQNNVFGTVGVVTESEDPLMKVIEITPYRIESAYSDARRPDEVMFTKNLDEDLKRRDFTINAIAYNIEKAIVVDHFEGEKDIMARRIRTVGDADERFAEDALRMMRAVRLASELDFMIEGETLAAIAKNVANLGRISKERIRDEFGKIIASPQPMQGIILFEKLGMLPYVMPYLLDAIGVEQNGAHVYHVYEHLLRSVQHAADKNYPFEVRLAALFHDIGKPASRRWSEEKKDYTFHGHEVIGARMTKKALEALRFPRETIDTVVKLVRWHMFFSDPALISLSAVRRTIRNVGEGQIVNLLDLRICDRIGTGRPKEQPFRFRQYKAMVDEALRDPISVKMLKINGLRIMEVTGEKPGPMLGDTLHALLEEVLEDPTKNTAEYLEGRAGELMKLPAEELRALGQEGREAGEEEEATELEKLKRKHKVI